MSENQDKKTPSRPTDAEYEQRVLQVYKFLLLSMGRSEIVAICGKKWNISTRSADRLIADATKMLMQETEAEKESAFSTAVQQLKMMLNATLEAGDFKTALSIRRELNELQRLKEIPGNINITQNTFTISESDKELL